MLTSNDAYMLTPTGGQHGTLVAELANIGGLINLEQRRLVADPAGQFRSLTTAPELLGL